MARRNRESAAASDGATSRSDGRVRAVQSRPAVRVEYPGEGEVITGPSYTIHIAAAPGADGVEVSIDRGEWRPCREALGLWWHDWTAFETGDHELVARANMGDGLLIDSAPRRFWAD